jgi:hypothetical protein
LWREPQPRRHHEGTIEQCIVIVTNMFPLH